MAEVQQIVLQAQKVYEGKREKSSKAKKWVDAFASSMIQYAGVFDVLAQADPLHAGLAWGAIKFVFAVSCKSVCCVFQV
jgi:hypothetical protein